MESDNTPCISEEPYTGWLRYEVAGEKPFFKTPFPRTIIRDQQKLLDYLEKQKSLRNMLDIDPSHFSFKRRLGLKKKENRSNVVDLCTPDVADGVGRVNDSCLSSADILDRLSRNGNVVNHRKLLCQAAASIDNFRDANGAYANNDGIYGIKKQLLESENMQDLMEVLGTSEALAGPLMLMLADICLSEICCVNVSQGPLVEFPPSVNENIYFKTVDFGMKKCT